METYVATRTLFKLISEDFAPVIRTQNLASFIISGYEINLKVLVYLVLLDLKG